MNCEELLKRVAVCDNAEMRARFVEEAFIANMGLTINFMNEMCGNSGLREDFLQVAYIAMYKAGMSFKEDSGYSMLSYYRMWLRHESYQLWLKSGFTKTSQEVPMDADLSDSVFYNKSYRITECVEREFMNQLLWERINSVLPERYVLVLVSRFKHNKTLSSIGNELGISAERVRQLIQKSCSELRNDPCVAEVAHYYYYL